MPRPSARRPALYCLVLATPTRTPRVLVGSFCGAYCAPRRSRRDAAARPSAIRRCSTTARAISKSPCTLDVFQTHAQSRRQSACRVLSVTTRQEFVCVCLFFFSFLCCFLCLYFFAFRIDFVIFWGIHAKFSGNLAVSPESTSFPRKVRRFPQKTRHFSTFAKSAPRHQPPRKRSNYVQSASVAVCRTRNVERLDAPGFWRHFADLSHAAAAAPCVRIRGFTCKRKSALEAALPHL